MERESTGLRYRRVTEEVTEEVVEEVGGTNKETKEEPKKKSVMSSDGEMSLPIC